LVGRVLAPDPGLATLPLALQFVGLMATTRLAAAAMGRWGRRAGFTVGAGCGVVAGAVATTAILEQTFALFCLGAALTGVFLAHAMHYRFAAADTAPPEAQGRAISWVMAGGVLAAVAGPQLANLAKDMFAPITYAGAYAVLAALCLAQVLLLQVVNLPAPGATAARPEPGAAAPARRPAGFVPAVLCGMVAYGSMNLVMAVTPPAMADCGLAFGAAAFVIQWHIFAMYAPSFVTGHLIERLGLQRVLASGVVLMLAAVAVNTTGLTLANFSIGLLLLGAGWNLMFVGATTWLTRIQSADNSARLQGVNDVYVFATVAATALGSGWLFSTMGWVAVNLAIVPALLLALGLILRAAPEPALAMPRAGS
jgi:MFS family permease